MKNAFVMWSKIVLISLLVSCTRIEIKDYEFCGDKGKFGATCVHSLNDSLPARRVFKADWDAERIGMVCTKAENIADIQSSIDRFCNKNRTMCYYAKEGVDTAKKTLTNIQKVSQ